MKKLWFFLLLPVVSMAQPKGQDFRIKGNLKLVKPVDWVYLSYVAGDQRITDSTQLKNGDFAFSGKIEEPTLAVLGVKFVKAAGEKESKDYLQFFLEPNSMTITAKDSLKVNSVTGSAGHLDYLQLVNAQKPYNDKLSKLYEAYTAARSQGNAAGMQKIEEEINRTEEEMNDKVFGSFVKAHPASPVALYAMKQYAGYDIDPNKAEPMFKTLSPALQAYPSGVALNDRITIAKKTAVGQMAMEFTQNDTSGNPLSLSSLRGKYVLVDFWASWCGPCRQENPNVVKAFQNYKDKNFTVLGVSLDRPNAKERWLKAIHDDGLAWAHVSDLKYWDNEVAKQYGIRSIPANLLIDPQGKIIARNIRGEELQKKLQEIFNR